MRPASLFQSAPPRGGRQRGARFSGPNPSFQSTPPRGGRLSRYSYCARACLFQSTPPRGGRRVPSSEGRGYGHRFNPRPRVGGDAHAHDALVMRWDVSIHAPAWGATGALELLAQHRKGFNPRPRVGGDLLAGSGIRAFERFNPRPRVGGDSIMRQTEAALPEFQSTPPRGGRHAVEGPPSVEGEVSIHAPAWGATGRPGT